MNIPVTSKLPLETIVFIVEKLNEYGVQNFYDSEIERCFVGCPNPKKLISITKLLRNNRLLVFERLAGKTRKAAFRLYSMEELEIRYGRYWEK